MRNRSNLGIGMCALAAAALVAVAGAGCKTRKGQGGQDAGTSTGLPYRPPGQPDYVDRPQTFPIYPTPTPARSLP